MAAETARKFEALEAQAQMLMALFIKAGFEAVAPSILQPADVFLDVVGETLRARTYVFNDPEGSELCLRPDLTVPTCRLYLERHPDADVKARYCYNGPIFRFQPHNASPAHPREFRQAGLESFGDSQKAKADAEILSLAQQALRQAGLTATRTRIGDVGLFHALLGAIEMPERWRRRLRHRLWRPDAFRAELKRLTTVPGEATQLLPADVQKALDPSNRAQTESALAQYLEANSIEPVGARTITEIADRLLEGVEDARCAPLPPEATAVIESFLKIAAPARAAGARLKDLMTERGLDITEALDAYHQRLQKLTAAGVDLAQIEFSAEFGLRLEYYTGFVFEITTPELGPQSPVVGGGRYDGLIGAIGAPQPVPAVGCAIHTERLLTVAGGGSP